MKKYQNWLDYQLYNNHLQNLIQIKKRKQTKFHLRCQTSYPKHSSHHGFTIYEKQQSSEKCKHSQSLTKSYFINKENIEYEKRIRNAPSVISRKKMEKEYQRNHWWVKKKNNLMNICSEKREKNMKSFFRINEEKSRSGYHKYSLKFHLQAIPKLPINQFGSYWFEIGTYEEKSLSAHFKYEDLINKQIQILLRFRPKNTIVKLKVHYSKGLDYVNGGEYTFSLPNLNSQKQYSLKCTKDNKKKIHFLLLFQPIREISPTSIF